MSPLSPVSGLFPSFILLDLSCREPGEKAHLLATFSTLGFTRRHPQLIFLPLSPMLLQHFLLPPLYGSVQLLSDSPFSPFRFMYNLFADNSQTPILYLVS